MEKDLVNEIDNLNKYLDQKYEARLLKYKKKINKIIGNDIYEDGSSDEKENGVLITNPEECDETCEEPAIKNKIQKYMLNGVKQRKQR